MNSLPKPFFLNLFSLWLITSILPFTQNNTLLNLFPAALTLSLLNLVFKPILNLLMTPVNLLTFGLLRWFPSLAIIYITTLIIPSFKIRPLTIEPFNLLSLHFPALHFGLLTSLLTFTALLIILKKMLSNTLK